MNKIKLLAFLFLLNSPILFAQKRTIAIVYIGDSITFGAGLSDPSTQSPPVIASAYLQKRRLSDTIILSNQGRSGFTTVNFLPSGDTFNMVEHAANTIINKPGILIFTIMLGTNDSAIEGPKGAPVAPADYQKNLRLIIDRLLKDYPGCKVIVQQPVWYSPNTYNGARYLQAGLDRLQSYFPEIKQLVKSYDRANKNQVFLGDTKAFDYFKTNYLTDFQAENGHQGTFYLHPNQKGAVALGTLWGEAIYNIIKNN
jgi:lysophospholipase L1-like esterase